MEPNSALVLRLPLSTASEKPPEAPRGAPEVMHRRSVFEFDLRQHKSHTEDWQKAFVRASRLGSRG